VATRGSPNVQAEPNISWTELTKFVGQLNHDLRNHLNAVELQAACLSEIVREPEAESEIKRLREMTGDLCAHLQRLSASLAGIQPNPMRYPASEFVEDLRAKLALEQPELATEVEWKDSLGEEALHIDPHLLQEAFLELFCNAAAHERGKGVVAFESSRDGESIKFILREPKTRFDGGTEHWGSRPLQRIRSGHYGLGLFRARSIFETHHGTMHAQFDPAASTLVTAISLPILMA
jgi:light-regulated signal transduction histidine kinase (bacteriophytochrome)